MSLRSDTIANKVVRESVQDITELVSVDEIGPLLFSWNRITLPDFDRLQNLNGSLTEQKRKYHLYFTALADKGQQGLDAFLKALDETAYRYEPHSLLAERLRAKLNEAHESGVVASKQPSTSDSVVEWSVTESSQHTPELTPIDCSEVVTNRRHYPSTSTATSGYETDSAVTLTTSLLERSSHSLSDMTSLKLIILGNVGVGKTSLMNRFLYNTFSDSVAVTIGGTRKHCFLSHKTMGMNVNLAIWDTAGQEKFHCISPSFYHNIDVVIMVFDMTDNEQRRSLHGVEDWNTQLHQHSSKADVPIILAGNKCKSSGINKTIAEHAKHMARQLCFHSFMEVSAKENFGVEALFERAVTLALESSTSSSSNQDRNVVNVSENTTPRGRRTCPC